MLTDFCVSNYIKHRKGEGAAQATINGELATLSHFLNRALEWGWIKSKPKVDKGEEVRKQIVVLSAAQKQALITAAEGDQDPFTWLFVAVAMGTAMRHSEILRVRWDEMQFDQRRIYIGKAKAGQRTQPMPPRLAATMEAEWRQLGEPEEYVFPTSRKDAKNPHRTTMATQFQRTVMRAGLNPSKVTPHVLRHTAITELVQAGVDLPTIQKVSGHKTLLWCCDTLTCLTHMSITRWVFSMASWCRGVSRTARLPDFQPTTPSEHFGCHKLVDRA